MTGNIEGLDEWLVQALKRLENMSKVPIHVTSGYRPHDADSSHKKGLAADIRVRGGVQRFELVSAALAVGFRRIGVYDLHIHLDLDQTKPFPVLWCGKSQ